MTGVAFCVFEHSQVAVCGGRQLVGESLLPKNRARVRVDGENSIVAADDKDQRLSALRSIYALDYQRGG